MQKFVRDVGINVLANLVAGALVYLRGVWIGPRGDVYQLTSASIALLCSSAIWVCGFTIARTKGLRRQIWAVADTSTMLVVS
jgi:hypothetical protein